ncbi:MAG: patatin-like phospholipase family protein [Alphaproteobacteria bacterium]|nr:patatin-like phospholipase family protein [Alphaproteobacteria bacterium]
MISKKRSLFLMTLGLLSCCYPMELQAMELTEVSETHAVAIKRTILSEKLDQMVLNHLKGFKLSAPKIDSIWEGFIKVMPTKGPLSPLCLASKDPHFIAVGLWRAHEEEKNTSLPLKSILSCLLTKEFSSINKKISLDDLQLLRRLIQSNPYFTNLELFKAGITDSHLSALGTIPHLLELSLEENEITDEGLGTVMSYQNLQKLNLSKNKITSAGAGLLAKSLILKHLNLYKNPIGDDGAVHLSHNSSLNYLDLRETGIGDEGAEALANHKMLTDLRLRYNKITDKGAEFFLNSHHLTHLELARNQISEDLVAFLERLAPSNGYLNDLNDAKSLPRSELPPQKDRVRILAIDGGGIRGILPGCLMKYVEDGLTQKLGSQFYFARHLDLVAGTSTGGIITLGLVMPGERGRPKYTTQTLLDLYTTKGPEIFPAPWSSMKKFFTSPYKVEPLERYLKEYFGDTYLSESLCPTLITSFDLKNNKAHTFDSHKAKRKDSKNFSLRDAGRATSAAPTYFPSAKIKNKLMQEFECVDGGIYANNPTLLAIKRAQQLYPDAKEYVVYSFGTGKSSKKDLSHLGSSGLLKWGVDIANILMANSLEYTERLIKKEVQKDQRIKYVRLQTELKASETEMDNTKADNIQNLLAAAEQTIDAKKQILDEMIEEFYKDFEKSKVVNNK